MARVEYKSTPPGVLLDRAGNARSGVTITHTGTAPFAAAVGGGAYGGALTTNIDGEVPGWLDPGVYVMADPTTGKSWTFEVGGGATTTNEPSTTEKEALAGSSGSPSSSNKYVTNADARNSDARLPLHTVGFQAGVVAAGDLLVTQRAAGANQSVDVATGEALVLEASTSRLRYVKPAAANLPVGAPHATLPRIDKVYVTTAGVLGYVEGTATGGATLDNMTGQPATPSDALLLEALLRPAATANVTTANMRNRRAWARGAYWRTVRTTNAAAGSNYTTTSATDAEVDSTNLKPRIECVGNPIRVTLRAGLRSPNNTSYALVNPWVDGAAPSETASATFVFQAYSTGGTNEVNPFMQWDLLPSADTHRFSFAFRSSLGGATTTLVTSAASPLQMTVEEIVRQNASNS